MPLNFLNNTASNNEELECVAEEIESLTHNYVSKLLTNNITRLELYAVEAYLMSRVSMAVTVGMLALNDSKTTNTRTTK